MRATGWMLIWRWVPARLTNLWGIPGGTTTMSPGSRFDRALTDGEEHLALLDDERLLVRVPMQSRPGPRLVVAEEEGHLGTVRMTIEYRGVLASGKLVDLD
jgi:hypothetical protein